MSVFTSDIFEFYIGKILSCRILRARWVLKSFLLVLQGCVTDVSLKLYVDSNFISPGIIIKEIKKMKRELVCHY